MPDHGDLMIDEVASELVSRGIPKYDHNPRDRDWKGPSPCWWVVHLEPLPELPRTALGISGDTDGYEWQLEVSTCSFCDAVVCTELIDEDGHTFASVQFWPGLDVAIRLHRHTRELWEAEMERFMRKEQGQPPQWRAELEREGGHG